MPGNSQVNTVSDFFAMLTIRAAAEGDIPTIYSMLSESSREQGAGNALCADPDNLREDGFGPAPKFFCLLAEWCGEPAGLALYFFLYSTWTNRKGLYLEDLYTDARFRRRGVAKALMTELARIAIDNRAGYMQWGVLDTNTAAQRFYESVGAKKSTGWSLMRVSGDKLWILGATKG